MHREISLFFHTAHLSWAWSASLFSARRPAAKKGKTAPPQYVNYGIRGRVPPSQAAFSAGPEQDVWPPDKGKSAKTRSAGGKMRIEKRWKLRKKTAYKNGSTN